MVKYWVAFISLTLCLVTCVTKASNIAVCTNNDDNSSVTLQMDMKNWLVLKHDGKSITARAILQANEHGSYVIKDSRPIRANINHI